MGSPILLVEGRNKGLSLSPLLEKKEYSFETIHTRRDTLAWLENTSPDLIIVDARALRFNPYRLCQMLRDRGNQLPILLILPQDAEQEECGATMVLQGGLTPRKFFNWVKRLLSAPSSKRLRAGDLVLDLTHRIVIRGDQRHRLTPKQAHLLEVFIRNSGRVLTRSFLMKEVWDTNFVGDTRTLEVHVHWLRKAIEEDTSNPVYLTTVRKLGYRFDVPEGKKRTFS